MNFWETKEQSISPLTYCEGGFYGGHLQPNDKIAPVLKSATASFGITGLNELNVLYNGKTITEDGQFPLEVMEYINKKVEEIQEKRWKIIRHLWNSGRIIVRSSD